MFLAFAIFLSMLSESLPTNSLTLPIFSLYLILINVLSTMYVILTVVVLNVYHKFDSPIPSFLRSFHILCRCSQGSACNSKFKQKSGQVNTDSLSKQDTGTGLFLTKDNMNAQSVDPVVTSMDVSRTLDITFACMFSLLLVISTLIFGIVLGVGS